MLDTEPSRGLATAKVVLDRVLSSDNPYPKMTFGTMTLLRQGHKRTVQFVQVGDESGVDLRIEIYAIEKAAGDTSDTSGPPEMFPDLS